MTDIRGRHVFRGRNPQAMRDAVLDGNPRALRALLRQAAGPNLLTMPSTMAPLTPVEVRAESSGRLSFTGYASVTDTPYTITDWLGDYTETVERGAFAKTLGRRDLDVIFCFNHDWDGVPMARTTSGTLTLLEDKVGCLTRASLDPVRDDVVRLRSAMDDGTVNAMSFAFRVVEQTWNDDYNTRDIAELDMHGGDTSAVTHPANPFTAGTTALRAQARALVESGALDVVGEVARRERRGDSALSDATAAALRSVLSMLAAADLNLDAAQPILADVLGLPNTDTDTITGSEPDADEGRSSIDPALYAARAELAADPALAS